MSLYAIADLHLSLGTDKPMDVFPGWDGYVDRLTDNWRRMVTEEDTVVIAGDVSWGMSLESSKPDFAFLNSLPGISIESISSDHVTARYNGKWTQLYDPWEKPK